MINWKYWKTLYDGVRQIPASEYGAQSDINLAEAAKASILRITVVRQDGRVFTYGRFIEDIADVLKLENLARFYWDDARYALRKAMKGANRVPGES